MKRCLSLSIASVAVILAANTALGAGSGFKNEAAPSAGAVTPLMPEAGVPPIPVYDESGTYTKMNRVVMKGITVVVFYRGHWCPYCMKQLRGLQELTAELDALGVKLAAISPDKPARNAETRKEAALSFPLYSDSTLEFARAMGVAYKLDPDTAQKYQETLKESTGEETGQLPVPSVFITYNGRIHYTHWDADYTKRLSNEELMAAVKKVVEETKAGQ